MTKLILVVLLLAIYTTNAKVIGFDNSAVEQIFQNKKAALFLFTNGND